MRIRVVLPDRNVLIRVLEHRASILVHIEIIWRREDRDDRRKVLLGRLAVHRIPRILRFVPSDYRQQVVPFEELADAVIGVEV